MPAHRILLLPFLLLLFTFCSEDPDPTYNLTLTATPEEGGSVSDLSGDYDPDTVVEVRATPNENWLFNGWEGDFTGDDRTAQIIMDSDKDVAALFTKRNYPLTINIEGEGEVLEEVIEQKTTEYPFGTLVEMTAEPADGWRFSEWQGDLTGSTNHRRITIEDETEVTAVFEPITFNLTIETEGEGYVTQELEQKKTTEYSEGDRVTLTAESDEGWLFAGWEGDLSGDENPATITMDSDKEVTAVFLRFFTLTTTAIPEEGGTINPEGGEFVRDTDVEIEAIPASSGWEFDRWEGDFSGSLNPISLTMNGNKTLVAHFNRRQFTVEVDIEGEGEVETVLLSGTETENGYLFESEIELTANASEGWHFSGWTGDITSDENPLIVNVEDDTELTAQFSQFEGGTGSEEDPYRVSTVTQLQRLKSNLSDHFILINDIDASETESWNNGEGFLPIGNDENPFTGVLNGDGFDINGLQIQRNDGRGIGLFGVTENSTLSNFSLTNVEIVGSGRVGALAGVNGGTVDQVFVSGSVTGEINTGGFVGINNGTILNSYTHANVEGRSVVGGFAGQNNNAGEISGVYAAGVLAGSSNTGGLAGIQDGEFTGSYWDVDVSGEPDGFGEGEGESNSGLTTDQMTGNDAEINMDELDFENIWQTSVGYPILIWQDEE